MPPLRPIDPGLRDPSRRRRLYHDSAQPARVQLHVPPGDELEVSDVVAEQLVAADSHFKDLDKDLEKVAASHAADAKDAAAEAKAEAEQAKERAAVESTAPGFDPGAPSPKPKRARKATKRSAPRERAAVDAQPAPATATKPADGS